jgi:uncharacterized membrane protein|tara:strand:+ start:723 stop:899 length:177 start_codon:yes stop_codon:yes gene_type:complete
MSVIADKAWYKSKTIWTAVVVCAASIAGEFGIEIPESVFGVLAALGLYGVRDAVGKSS